MNIECIYCNALHWQDEYLMHSSIKNPKFGLGCQQGKIKLPLLNNPLLTLQHLFESSNENAKEFRANIHQYNAAHAFTSLDVTIDQTVLQGHGSYCFRVNRELCHLSSLLIPTDNNEPAYAQLYIYDAALAYLIQINSYANNTSTANLTIYLHYNNAIDRHCYNLPTIDKIAIILPSNGSIPKAMHDIDFFSFRLFACHNEFSTILREDILHADLYQGLADVAGSIANGELSLNNLSHWTQWPLPNSIIILIYLEL
ncbi:1021_t:CDS:2 [Cetraspora pellucida]|uniref:1021_t:CDS:1 n=1 Tax=Cetraspora pellucida TaxID=1433469 RepID=A0A9N8YV40_9GLOM|nr:1021_t:CDS:2 [Cetraspora pellucida]